jgi:hypothetical protein
MNLSGVIYPAHFHCRNNLFIFDAEIHTPIFVPGNIYSLKSRGYYFSVEFVVIIMRQICTEIITLEGNRFMNKRYLIRSYMTAFIVFFGLCISLCGCGSDSVDFDSGSHRSIIIDTDTGADDASAIILAARYPNVDIKGVTVLVGNVDLEQSTKNALMALEIAGSDAPVYKGADETYDGTKKTAYSVFGEDGMGDEGLINPESVPEDTDAVDFILDTVKNNPGEIEIVALGPATNIAKAIDQDPETM